MHAAYRPVLYHCGAPLGCRTATLPDLRSLRQPFASRPPQLGRVHKLAEQVQEVAQAAREIADALKRSSFTTVSKPSIANGPRSAADSYYRQVRQKHLPTKASSVFMLVPIVFGIFWTISLLPLPLRLPVRVPSLSLRSSFHSSVSPSLFSALRR